jgi:hypothetical protein
VKYILIGTALVGLITWMIYNDVTTDYSMKYDINIPQYRANYCRTYFPDAIAGCLEVWMEECVPIDLLIRCDENAPSQEAFDWCIGSPDPLKAGCY